MPGCTRYDDNWNCVSGGIGNGTQSRAQAIRAARAAGYEDSLDNGYEYVAAILNNPGWWSAYLTGDMIALWKFLIAFGYHFESASLSGKNVSIADLLPQCYKNKLGYLVAQYGVIGMYIFLGSQHSIRNKISDIEDGTLPEVDMTSAIHYTAGSWGGWLTGYDPVNNVDDGNLPFDWANPMPDKHPADLLESINDFADACPEHISSCDTKDIEGTLYVLTSWNKDVSARVSFFIVSYTQKKDW